LRDPSPDSDAAEVDVLVVGAGAGGMTAALTAAIEGLSVLLVEKSAQVGGTTASSMGTIWAPCTRQAREAGLADDIGSVRRYLDAAIGPDTDGRREAYLKSAPRVVDYLAQNSEVKFFPYAHHPDYLINLPGATLGGRPLAPLPFDGRLLGADFELVRAPVGEHMVAGGMMVGRDDLAPLTRPFASLRHLRTALALLARHASDRLRFSRGTRLLMGNALVARLFASLRRRGVPVWLNAPLKQLTLADGRVTGATVEHGGALRHVRVRRGVVLASGGFGGSVARLNEHVRPPLAHAVAFAGAEGDGARIARAIGAAFEDDHAQPAFWSPVSDTRWFKGGRGAFAHIALDRAKPGLIAVNAAGRRFVDEALSYHEFVKGMLRSHESVPTIPAWLVCDRDFIAKYGLGRIAPGRWSLRRFIASGYLIEAASLDALADKIKVDAAGLRDSVARHNRYAASGDDADFGKGATEFDRNNGDPQHRPNPCLGAIARPPFYAMAVYPSTLGTSIGIKTDADARVLAVGGEPIAGLYACGADMASIMRGNYPGPGINIGPALVFAYRAAMAMAARSS